MNFKLFLLLLLFPLTYHAQVKKVPATIVNPGSLYSTYDFTEDVGHLKPAIKLFGGASILTDITTYSQQGSWPSAMKELDSRLSHKEDIKKYKVYKIAATTDYCVLVVPAAENKHMDASMRPTRDIYFIMELQGASYEGNYQEAKSEEPEDDYSYPGYEEEESDWMTATIVNPGDLYSTFDLKNDTYAREIMVDSGILTEEEYDGIVALANEKGWPAGISTLSQRLAAADLIKQYTAYYFMDFGADYEYTLLWIPQEGNEHMPANMRPKNEDGFYFVIKSSGVEYNDY